MDFSAFVLAGVVPDLPDPSEDLSPVDALAYQVSATEDVTAIKEYATGLPLIATSSLEPDNQQDSEQTTCTLMQAARTDPVEAIEVEYGFVAADSPVLESLQDLPVDIIVSYWNRSETPDLDTLLSIVNSARKYGDIVYIETMAESPDDSLTMLAAIYEAADMGVTIGGACMGEIGRHARVAAPTYGSKLAYAPLDVEMNWTVPGQYSLQELAELINEFEEPTPPVSLHKNITNPMIRDN